MSLVKVVCPKCGEQIEIEVNNEASICHKCKEAFITSKAQLVDNVKFNYDNKSVIDKYITQGKIFLMTPNVQLNRVETQTDKDLIRLYQNIFDIDPNNVYGNIFRIFAHSGNDWDYETIIEKGNYEERLYFCEKTIEYIKQVTRFIWGGTR